MCDSSTFPEALKLWWLMKYVIFLCDHIHWSSFKPIYAVVGISVTLLVGRPFQQGIVIDFYLMRFQVAIAASMKVALFMHVVPCSLVDVHHCFGCAYYHLQGNEGSEHLWNVGKPSQTTQHNIPKGSHLLAFICLNEISSETSTLSRKLFYLLVQVPP